MAGQVLLAPPRIDEGHNVFLPGPALERGLPADVYRHLAVNSMRNIRRRNVAIRKNSVAGGTTAFPIARLLFPPTVSGASRPMSRSVTRNRFFRSGVAAPRLHQ